MRELTSMEVKCVAGGPTVEYYLSLGLSQSLAELLASEDAGTGQVDTGQNDFPVGTSVSGVPVTHLY